MIKSLLEIIDFLFNWITAQGLAFIPEIAGFIVIFCLIIAWRRLRRRRRMRLSARAKAPQPSSRKPATEDAPELPDKEEITQFIPETPEKPAEKLQKIEVQAPDQPDTEAAAGPEGFFKRLQNGLTKTRKTLGRQLDTIFSENQGLDDEALEQIEETLITADVGLDTTMALIDRLSASAAQIHDMNSFKDLLKKEMRALLETESSPRPVDTKPYVIMVVGVNGVGKTTTIGKLAAKYRSEGKKVILGAADTFRAAAVEQLEVWAQRADAEIVKHRDKADPAAVAYDAVAAALARNADVVIVDTAGRLHTKVNLMEQLKKIKRTIARQILDAPHEILLVVDATTGQNALSQAKLFHQHMGVTGIVLSKLDGTAKGGIVLGISHGLKIPIRYIGVGEQISDLQEFDPQLFVDALL